MPELIVGDVRPRVQYTADGLTTSFAYPFPVLAAADLAVVFDDGDAATSHTVTGIGASAGGEVVFDTAPPAGTRITIRRDMAVERASDFQEAGDFRAAAINAELDRFTLSVQQVESVAADAVRQAPHDVNLDLLLPPAGTRASKLLGFGTDGELAVYDRAATQADPALGGESNDGVNLGAGVGVYKDKSGVSLRFRSLKAGASIVLTEGLDEITVDSTALADVLTTAGDLVTQGVAGAERLPLGAADQVLKVNAAGTAPGWETLKVLAGAQVDFQVFTLTQDTATSFTPPADSGIALGFGLDPLGDPAGILFTWRTASGAYATKVTGLATAEVTTGALTGTTGTIGSITYAANGADGKLYVESRIAGTKHVAVLVFATPAFA